MKEITNLAVQKPIDMNLITPNDFGLTKIEPREYIKLKDRIDKDGGNGLQPILVREKGSGYEIIDGNQRYKIMKELDFDQIMCSIEVLSDKDVLLRAVQANKFKGTLDQLKVARIISDLTNVYDMNNLEINEALGYESEEIYAMQMLLELDDEEPEEEIEEEIDDEIEEIEEDKLNLDNEPIVLELNQDEMELITKLTVKSGLPRDKAIFASVALLRDSYDD